MRKYDLPSPLSANNLFVNVGRSRKKSPDYLRWCETAKWELKIQRPTLASGRVFLIYDIGTHRETGRMINTTSDLDNFLKCINDALVKGGALPDDNVKVIWASFPNMVADKTGVTVWVYEADEMIEAAEAVRVRLTNENPAIK